MICCGVTYINNQHSTHDTTQTVHQPRPNRTSVAPCAASAPSHRRLDSWAARVAAGVANPEGASENANGAHAQTRDLFHPHLDPHRRKLAAHASGAEGTSNASAAAVLLIESVSADAAAVNARAIAAFRGLAAPREVERVCHQCHRKMGVRVARVVLPSSPRPHLRWCCRRIRSLSRRETNRRAGADLSSRRCPARC